MIRISIAASTFAALAITPITAQRLTPSYSPSQLPHGLSYTQAIIVDVDNDGRVDILDWEYPDPAHWLLSRNDGEGRFADPIAVTSPQESPFVPRLVADFDGDGDVDVGYANETGWFIAWNNGGGGFPQSTQLTFLDNWNIAVAGDIDGDGDVDIVTQGAEVQIHSIGTYLNDGSGNFTLGTTNPGFSSLGQPLNQLLDTDGDGDLDFVSYRHWENDGAGNFTDTTTNRYALGFPPGGTHVYADLNGDGLFDLATPKELFFDDGTGTLVSALDFSNFIYPDVDVFDIENDGDLDVFLARSDLGSALLLRNDGAGVFTFESGWLEGFGTYRAHVVDVDGDGDVDLLGPPRTLFLGDGQGNFFNAAPIALSLYENEYRDSIVGDVDSDGDVDILTRTETEFRVHFNNGVGEFVAGTPFPLPSPDFNSGPDVEFADFDADGHLDFAYDLEIYEGDGTGGFAHVNSLIGLARTMTIADFDGDGDDDLATPSVVAFHTAGFAFQTVPTALGGDGWDMDSGDIDGDGDIDIVTAVTNGLVQLFSNDGNGGFTDVSANLPEPVFAGFARTARMADVDEDGDLDLLIGNENHTWQNLWFYENDGTGTFTDETVATFGFTPFCDDAVVADFDLDGDIDIFGTGYQRTFLENTPTGFVNRPFLWLGDLNQYEEGPILADLDNDGDQDVVMGLYNVGPQFFHNRRRHLLSPRLGRTGAAILLEAYVEADTTETVYPFVALTLFDPPLPSPWGPLHADAGAAITLPPQVAGDQAHAEWEFGVPPVPGLVGLELFSQALFVPSIDPASWRLSNPVRHTIVE